MSGPDFEVAPSGTFRALDERELEIQRLKNLVRLGETVIEDFLPNIGSCALDNIGDLNEFLLAAKAVRIEHKPEGNQQ